MAPKWGLEFPKQKMAVAAVVNNSQWWWTNKEAIGTKFGQKYHQMVEIWPFEICRGVLLQHVRTGMGGLIWLRNFPGCGASASFWLNLAHVLSWRSVSIESCLQIKFGQGRKRERKRERREGGSKIDWAICLIRLWFPESWITS